MLPAPNAGTSFVESLTPPGPDEQMAVSRYERSRAQMRAMGFSVIDDAEVAAEVEAAAAAQVRAGLLYFFFGGGCVPRQNWRARQCGVCA